MEQKISPVYIGQVVCARESGWNRLGRIKDSESGNLLTFSLNTIDDYDGGNLRKIGLRRGREVEFTFNEFGYINHVRFPFVDERPLIFGRWRFPF